MECITMENYEDMCRRVSRLENNDAVTGSSNFGRFLEWLESSDDEWINEINNNIE